MAEQERYDVDTGACPAHELLVQWREGQLPPEEFEAIDRHVESCAVCLDALELAFRQDPVSQGLRNGVRLLGDEDRTQVENIVRRMRIVGATDDPAAADTHISAHAADFPFLTRMPPHTVPSPARDEGVELGWLGSYRIRHLLGRGGMGLVFAAEDTQLQRPVAIKVMRREAEQKPGARERFLREARAAAAVRHEHVVTIHQVGETNDVPFLVMELLEGQSLETRCHAGQIPFPEILRIARQVADGLAAAHATGLTHRDIKPDNIWLECTPVADAPGSPRATRHFRVKLLDFGLARTPAGAAQITHNGMIVGTPAYMAPEQACGEPVDARSDLFSLGCVLFRLAAGRLPFQGETPLEILHALANETPPPLHQLVPQIPESFSRLVVALLERRPENRPASARVVAQELATIESEECGSPQGPLETSTKIKRLLILSVLSAALLALSVVAVLAVSSRTRMDDAGKLLPEKTSRQIASPSATVRDKPAPADALMRADISADMLARAGNGDPAKAPPELVAVLGGARTFPTSSAVGLECYTRFSPDGRLLATCADKEVRVFDADTGQVLHRLQHATPSSWFDFRWDSKVLAVSCHGGVTLWDLDSGKPLGELKGFARSQRGVSFTPSGQTLVTCDADGKARVWDVASKKPIKTLAPPKGHRFTQAPQIHPEGRLAALHASGPEPVVCVVDLASGDSQGQVPGTGPVYLSESILYQSTVRFSPDGKLLASVRNGQAVALFDVSSLKQVGEIAGGVSIVNFSADGNTLFKGHLWPVGKFKVCLDDVKTRKQRFPLKPALAVDFTWSDLSPDGRSIAIRAAPGNSVRLFDVATGQERFPAVGHQGQVTAVAVSPDGGSVASTSRDHRVLLWELSPGLSVKEKGFYPAAYLVTRMPAFSPDGKWLAAQVQETTLPGAIHIWEMASGKEVSVLRGQGRNWQRNEFAFPPQSGSLITSAGTALEKWQLPGGSPTTWDAAHDRPIESLAVHPDGQMLALGDKMGAIQLWNAPPSQHLHLLRCEGAVLRVRFSPDGRHLAATTAAPDAALYLWDLKTGLRTRSAGHTDSVEGLAWRSDSQALATASHDGTVRVWPCDRLAETRIIRLYAGKQGQLAFTPEGRHLLTANEDGSIFVLRLEPADAK